jgi:uncharacterized protein YbjT (DUF2867 family)
MSDALVLVTGATGKTGRRVARMLRERGVAHREASRSAAARFSWEDRSTWDAALESATAVYLVPPSFDGPGAIETTAEFARRAATAGASRVVLLSAPGLGEQGDAVQEAGLALTVLRPRWFFQNFSEDFLRDAVLGGELRLPAGDGQEGFIDAEDIAEVAVTALTEEGHAGMDYELTGPRLMTFADTAADIAQATGRTFPYVALTADEYVTEQIARGVPEDWARFSAGLYDYVRSGQLASLTDDVEHVLGRPPRDFTDYARTAAAEGAWQD